MTREENNIMDYDEFKRWIRALQQWKCSVDLLEETISKISNDDVSVNIWDTMYDFAVDSIAKSFSENTAPIWYYINVFVFWDGDITIEELYTKILSYA